jgi:hypothetical protein
MDEISKPQVGLEEFCGLLISSINSLFHPGKASCLEAVLVVAYALG